MKNKTNKAPMYLYSKIESRNFPIDNRQLTIINQQSTINNRSAFTLVELIVAISLAAMIMVITAIIFKQASSAFSQSDARSEVYQNVRAAFDIIKRDISGATLNTNYELFKSFDNIDKDDYLSSIKAKDKSDILILLSSTPNSNNQPIALITYYLKDNNILYKLEKKNTLNTGISSFNLETETEYKELGFNVSTLQFRYQDTNGTWVGKREGDIGSEEWDSITKKYLPDAVEVEITISDMRNRYTVTSTTIISIP